MALSTGNVDSAHYEYINVGRDVKYKRKMTATRHEICGPNAYPVNYVYM